MRCTLPFMRIVSLVPSWSEWLVDLGITPVGVTKFCIHPNGLHHRVARIGGTKNIQIDRIHSLRPDLIIACEEENIKEQVEALSPTVLLTHSRSIEGALSDMMRIAEAVGKGAEGIDWIAAIRSAWGAPQAQRMQAAYVIWQNPWMVAANDTYIHDVMSHWGIGNAFAHLKRYPSVEHFADANVILLSSEPFPFGQQHFSQLPASPNKIPALVVNGEAFSWYGSRMLHAVDDLVKVSDQITSLLSEKN